MLPARASLSLKPLYLRPITMHSCSYHRRELELGVCSCMVTLLGW